MPAPKGNKYAVGNKGGGRLSLYKPNYVKQAAKACEAGFTDREIAELFGVGERTIAEWKLAHEDFCAALKVGKEPADERVERSLYHRAIGYSHTAVKIFLRPTDNTPVYAPYIEQVPPDTTACIFWLKNRRPDKWRNQGFDLSDDDGASIEFTLKIGRSMPGDNAKLIEHKEG